MNRPPDHPHLARWRVETPEVARLTHLNNAGAALAPLAVRGAVAEYLEREAALGAYETAESSAGQIRGAREGVGALIGARGRNIALTQNATTGFAQALAAFDFRPGDRILTSRADYASNQIMYLALAQRLGVQVVRIPDGPEGGIDPEALERETTRRRPVLVAVTWVPTNSGLVQPVEAVGEVCRRREIPYLVDACQAVGQLVVDVDRVGCDYLSATARKFLRGPRGIGFLYAADRVLDAGAYPITVDMHGATWSEPDRFTLTPDARRFESWEISYALVAGVAAAAAYALEVGVPVAAARASELATYARERLAALPGVRVLDRGPELCAIATAEVAGRDAASVKLALRARGINTSATDREDAVIDMDHKGARSALRISPHYYNTPDEIDAAVAALAELLP
jgi:selenocysteine lyase/cysteine desulfurase